MHSRWILKPVSIILATFTPFAWAKAQPDCFRLEDNKRTPFEVLQIAKPPRFVARQNDYLETSPYYPATTFATTTASALSQPLQRGASGVFFERSYFQWVNRCIQIPGETPSLTACRNQNRSKGNLYVGIPPGTLKTQVRPLFSTYAKANACTIAQINAVLGRPKNELGSAGRKAGIVVLSNQEIAAIASHARTVTTADGESQTALVDVCVYDSDRLAPDVGAIVLDYEVWDYRTTSEVVAFLREIRTSVADAGRKLILYTNEIPRPANGLTSDSIRAVLAEVDSFAPTLWTGATKGNLDMGLRARHRSRSLWESYIDQLAVLTDNGARPLTANENAKIIWNISLFDINLDDARRLHEEFRHRKYRGIAIFRNYVKQGGSCSRPENQLTACLALGECGGDFGRDR